MKPVLIVSGGGFQGLGLLDALLSLSGIRPIVADVHAENVTRYLCPDYRVLPPLADERGFLETLQGIVTSEEVVAVLPATAYELPLLARIRTEMATAGVAVAVCSPSLLELLLDKHATTTFLARHGIPCQAVIDPHTHDFDEPLFGRPLHGWGGRGTSLLRTREERDRAAAGGTLDGCMWSAYLAGFEEYSADFAIDPAGRVSPAVLRKRLRTSGGFAVISESASDSEIEVLVQRTSAVMAANGGGGFFNVQVIRPATAGAPALVSDINPRYGTSSGHGLGEGINPVAFFLGLDPCANAISGARRRPVKTVRRLQDLTVPRLPSRPRAVVFDLDDTLVDHKQWFARKALAAHAAVASDWNDADAFRQAALGLIDEGERRHFIDQLGERLGWSPEQHAAYLSAFREARVETPLYTDVLECLAAIRTMGFATALLTDNPPSTQRQKIAGAPGLGSFDAIVFSQDTGAEKPDARAFTAVADALALPASALCMVGDNLFRDGMAAIAAGYGSAIVLDRPGGFVQSHPELARLAGAMGNERLVRAQDLIIAREILSGS